jgi:hypothetical protein
LTDFIASVCLQLLFTSKLACKNTNTLISKSLQKKFALFKLIVV